MKREELALRTDADSTSHTLNNPSQTHVLSASARPRLCQDRLKASNPSARAGVDLRIEIRVMACGPVARSQFGRCDAFLTLGIILIRLAAVGELTREAGRRRARQLAHAACG